MFWRNSFCLLVYLKYLPVTFSSSGSNATYSVVCAPEIGVFMNGQVTIRKNQPDGPFKMPICRVSSVLTMPGCKELAVTPVPFNRLANSLVNSTFANLLWLYASASSYFVSLFKSVVFIWPRVCARLETTTTRLGADFYSDKYENCREEHGNKREGAEDVNTNLQLVQKQIRE